MPPGAHVHRFFGSRDSPSDSLQCLAGGHDGLSHTPTGTQGCFLCTLAVPALAVWETCPPPHGQHKGGMLYQQAEVGDWEEVGGRRMGGERLRASLSENQKSPLVQELVHPDVSQAYSGQAEHSCRLGQLTTHGSSVTMDSQVCSS